MAARVGDRRAGAHEQRRLLRRLLDVEDERDDDAAARDAKRDGDKEDGGEGEVIPRLPDCGAWVQKTSEGRACCDVASRFL